MRPAMRLFRPALVRQVARPLRQRTPFPIAARSSPLRTPPSIATFSQRRLNSSLSVPQSEADLAKSAERPREPSYELTFTCKPCGERSAHMVTKHGYHRGTVLITCPGCKSRHVISDHLNIFMDEKSTLEDILSRKLESGKDISSLLKKGRLGMRKGEMVAKEGDDDIEFWDDGTETQHHPSESANPR